MALPVLSSQCDAAASSAAAETCLDVDDVFDLQVQSTVSVSSTSARPVNAPDADRSPVLSAALPLARVCPSSVRLVAVDFVDGIVVLLCSDRVVRFFSAHRVGVGGGRAANPSTLPPPLRLLLCLPPLPASHATFHLGLPYRVIFDGSRMLAYSDDSAVYALELSDAEAAAIASLARLPS